MKSLYYILANMFDMGVSCMNTPLSELPLADEAKGIVSVFLVKALREWAHSTELVDRLALSQLVEHGLVDVDKESDTFKLTTKGVARLYYDVVSPYFQLDPVNGNICGGVHLWVDTK